MRTKQRNHIEVTREKYASNQQLIQKVAGISVEAQQDLKFETGCRFLELIYPRDTEFEVWYQEFSRSKDFWDWWNIEWHNKMDDLAEMLKPIHLVGKFYLEYMSGIIQLKSIHDSYHHNFLKHHDKQN